jgi:hypothetical protein
VLTACRRPRWTGRARSAPCALLWTIPDGAGRVGRAFRPWARSASVGFWVVRVCAWSTARIVLGPHTRPGCRGHDTHKFPRSRHTNYMLSGTWQCRGPDRGASGCPMIGCSRVPDRLSLFARPWIPPPRLPPVLDALSPQRRARDGAVLVRARRIQNCAVPHWRTISPHSPQPRITENHPKSPS